VIASWVSWWGGYSYGPRLLTDTIPWFVMLAILGCKGRENYRLRTLSKSPSRGADRTLIGVTAMLAVVSVAINGWGANSIEPSRVDFDSHQALLWDWRSPQFLAGVIPDRGSPSAAQH